MSDKSYQLTEDRLDLYPMDWQVPCPKCLNRFDTKLRMEHNRRQDELLFFRERFCNRHSESQLVVIKKMDEDGTEYPSREHVEDITQLTTH